MRYIPVNQLKNGMILGQDIHDAAGRMLLAKRLVLSEENISYIAFLGIPGVYIDDDFTKDIQIEEIVRPEIRQQAVSLVQEIFMKAENQELPPEEQHIRAIVTDVVNAVLDNDDVMYNLVELKTYDDYTYFHSTNVAILSGVIGAKCSLGESELEDLVTSGFLHDMGKVFIDPELINAPRKLTEDERIKMMAHPQAGYDYLKKNYNFSETILQAVYEHHEWYNGYGYPMHKTGRELIRNSKILQAADVYDAMTSKRPCHAPYLPSEVMEYIMGRSGMEFDPYVVKVMANELCVYPVGCEVELSDGRRAIVAANHNGFILRPTVKILDTGEMLDLKANREALHVTIVKLMM